MGGAVFHRDRAFAPVSRVATDKDRRLPRGYGLLLGAGVSLGLWAAIGLGIIGLLT